jgi:hypothetical protein
MFGMPVVPKMAFDGAGTEKKRSALWSYCLVAQKRNLKVNKNTMLVGGVPPPTSMALSTIYQK